MAASQTMPLKTKKEDNPSREKNRSRSMERQQRIQKPAQREALNVSLVAGTEEEDTYSQTSSNLALLGACGVDPARVKERQVIKSGFVWVFEI